MPKSSSFKPKVNQLVLGTVQLGMSYGIANKTGQPDQATTIGIIQLVKNVLSLYRFVLDFYEFQSHIL